MAILGTELTSRLGGGGDIKPTPHEQQYRHHPASLDGNGLSAVDPLPSELDTNGEPKLTSNLSGGEKLNKISSNLDIDINPIKYVDNLPR